jgi:hypothetical protein
MWGPVLGIGHRVYRERVQTRVLQFPFFPAFEVTTVLQFSPLGSQPRQMSGFRSLALSFHTTRHQFLQFPRFELVTDQYSAVLSPFTRPGVPTGVLISLTLASATRVIRGCLNHGIFCLELLVPFRD